VKVEAWKARRYWKIAGRVGAWSHGDAVPAFSENKRRYAMYSHPGELVVERGTLIGPGAISHEDKAPSVE
jgi:hypothetical protein